MKRFIALMLALISVFTFSISAFAIGEGTIEPKVGGSGLGYREQTLNISHEYGFVGWHPDFPEPLKRDFYFFTNESTSTTLTLGAEYSGFSVTVNITRAGNMSGSGLFADSSKWSRPAVYGEIYTEIYYAGMYNYNTNTWVNKSTATRYWVEDPEIIIEHNANKNLLT